MDVVSGIVFSNRAPERRSKSAEKNSATQTKNRPSGAAIRYEITGWPPSGPVSYTHLDVYKRQTLTNIN